MIDQDIEEES